MKKINALVEEYDRLYKHLPDTQEELEDYIVEKYNVNLNKVEESINEIKNIEWETIHLVLPLVPKPTPRPRMTSGGHVYVKNAKLHKQFFESIIRSKEIVFTVTKIDIKTYLPIPTSSMNSTEILLAQKGYIRPISGGDWDNLAKTYCDMMQGVLISNDNIIVDGSLSKFYSLKPKVDITLSYQVGFDSKYNRRKVITSKLYKSLIESVK